ncbi:hypothetical protein [Marinicauda pacifica]|jgi:hypothetical protein|uniref:hypothetical protein n=1 Tax=Marinicauda pacifica TaxID=1133559 RepID=UPI0035C850F2
MIKVATIATSLVLLGVSSTSAQDVTIPQSDYWMSATVQAEGERVPMDLRHHDGKVRLETTFQEQEAVVLLDMHGEEATVLVDSPAMKMAMIIPASEANFAPAAPENLPEPMGSAVVAGESCDIYRVDDPNTGEQGDMCMTSDSIVLRLESEGETLFEADALERADQDPSLFEVPPGYQVMRMPAGAGGPLSGH